MKIVGPDRYKLTFDPKGFSVLCAKGTSKFSDIATLKLPKLYIVSVDEKPMYVGVTKQSIRSRLRSGWNADGTNGYHGYKWRHKLSRANLDIWCDQNSGLEGSSLELQTVEAEIVFLIRSAGQWPKYQTEIHFYHSAAAHRKVAARIVRRYGI
jgi:hypothetical protein